MSKSDFFIFPINPAPSEVFPISIHANSYLPVADSKNLGIILAHSQSADVQIGNSSIFTIYLESEHFTPLPPWSKRLCLSGIVRASLQLWCSPVPCTHHIHTISCLSQAQQLFHNLHLMVLLLSSTVCSLPISLRPDLMI